MISRRRFLAGLAALSTVAFMPSRRRPDKPDKPGKGPKPKPTTTTSSTTTTTIPATTTSTVPAGYADVYRDDYGAYL